jgi:murein DD-endopeptidase MepM/ murein hydrolase activator NlpD
VGDTGYTTGPHLHFELRIGQNSYFYTRNPELWLAPPQGWGVLAGRIMEENRDLSHSLPVNIRSVDTNHEWTVNTYGPEAVNSDEYYQENLVISDLPAGHYIVTITYKDKTEKITVEVLPGRVTYFVYRGTFGFISTEPPPAATLVPTPTTTPTP